jgi:hypothetical protein
MSATLRKVLCAWLAAVFAAPALAQQVATLDGDKLRLCGATFTTHQTLKPSVLMVAVAADAGEGQFGLAYRKLAARLSSALSEAERTMPKVPQILATFARADDSAITERHFRTVPSFADDRVLLLFESISDAQLEINCRESVPRYVVEIVTVAQVAGILKTRQREKDFRVLAAAVAQQAHDVDNLLKNGLPMWPWELWANGKRLPKSDAEPLFRSQWVLLRPTAGMAVDTRSRADGDLQASVGIEPVGFIRYRGDDYSKWWGASLLVTTSSKSGVGLGALLRWNNFVLGATRNQAQQAGQSDSTVLFIGVDLYEFLNKQRGQIDDLGNAAQKLGGQLLLPP